MPRHRRSVSISDEAYQRLRPKALRAGTTISEILASIVADLPGVPIPELAVVVVDVPLYMRIAKVARRRGVSFGEVLDAAIVRAIDDAERFPDKVRSRRKPRVDHAHRRAS